MKKNLCVALAIVVFALVLSPIASALDSRLEIPPYQIPTYDGKPHDFKAYIPPLKSAPRIDVDGLFRAVINCFPERIQWGVEVSLQGGLRETFDKSNSITTFDTSGLSKHYIGIVASMPLYSATEINTERRAEVDRREKVAVAVKELLAAIAQRHRAERELGIFVSVNARSQQRVAIGIAPAEEQIGYLEKVASAQSSFDEATAAIDGARLALVGQCRDEVATGVNEYIIELANEK
jgi:hypothetical protein